MSNSTFRIGVDGGGSKTDLILVDAAGAVLATHTAAGCNPSQCGPDRAREVVSGALQALRAKAPPGGIQATRLFMAGSPELWRGFAASLTDYGRVVAAPDSLPVLELATQGAPGLVLHAGTGSFVAARAPDGSLHYAGGLGWKFNDAGSGYDLGRRAIARALLELQGWAPPSALGEALQALTKLPDHPANVRFFYDHPEANATIAAFAPRVLALAAQGCGPAQSVLTDTLTALVDLARLVTAKLFAGATVPCGVSGAILTHEPALSGLKRLAALHRWPVTLSPITAPPIEGVRRLLARGET